MIRIEPRLPYTTPLFGRCRAVSPASPTTTAHTTPCSLSPHTTHPGRRRESLILGVHWPPRAVRIRDGILLTAAIEKVCSPYKLHLYDRSRPPESSSHVTVVAERGTAAEGEQSLPLSWRAARDGCAPSSDPAGDHHGGPRRWRQPAWLDSGALPRRGVPPPSKLSSRACSSAAGALLAAGSKRHCLRAAHAPRVHGLIAIHLHLPSRHFCHANFTRHVARCTLWPCLPMSLCAQALTVCSRLSRVLAETAPHPGRMGIRVMATGHRHQKRVQMSPSCSCAARKDPLRLIFSLCAAAIHEGLRRPPRLM